MAITRRGYREVNRNNSRYLRTRAISYRNPVVSSEITATQHEMYNWRN